MKLERIFFSLVNQYTPGANESFDSFWAKYWGGGGDELTKGITIVLDQTLIGNTIMLRCPLVPGQLR